MFTSLPKGHPAPNPSALLRGHALRRDHLRAAALRVVRAFARMRDLLFNHKALAEKLAELDARVGNHDEQLAAIIQAIRQLAAPDGPIHGRRIGFNQ